MSVFIVNSMFCVDMQVVNDDVPGEIYEDEDDENDENNWRNDYPDEDEFLPDEDGDGEKGMPVINIVCFHAVRAYKSHPFLHAISKKTAN